MRISRRSLLAGGVAATAGAMVPRMGAAATETWMKPALWQMEAEGLLDTLPARNPAVRVVSVNGQTILRVPVAGCGTIARALNATGRFIWDACDGKRSVTQLAGDFSRHFNVRPEQAHVDCMAFLFHLKLFNAILV